MRAPKVTSIKVDGRPVLLEDFLLSTPHRPLPKAPTHYVVADVVNTDLSVKRVTVYYNPDDTWRESSSFGDSPRAVGNHIAHGLQFLNSDPNTLAYKFWIIEIATDEVVHYGGTFTLSKCEW